MFIGLFFTTLNLFAFGNETLEILLPGKHHGDEVPAQIGDSWFALAKVDGQFLLKRVQPKISSVFDPVLDADENDKANFTGRSVDVPDKDTILVIKSNRLKPGKIESASIYGDSFVFAKKKYVLTHICKKKNNENGLSQCKAYLVQGKTKQFLGDTVEGDSDFTDTIRLNWAGDIDRDGRPDFIFSFDTYNNGKIVLFLSSVSEEFASPVAEFSWQGC